MGDLPSGKATHFECVIEQVRFLHPLPTLIRAAFGKEIALIRQLIEIVTRLRDHLYAAVAQKQSVRLWNGIRWGSTIQQYHLRRCSVMV